VREPFLGADTTAVVGLRGPLHVYMIPHGEGVPSSEFDRAESTIRCLLHFKS
jgi:hypothetical protein